MINGLREMRQAGKIFPGGLMRVFNVVDQQVTERVVK
jgi:hypothetical protein